MWRWSTIFLMCLIRITKPAKRFAHLKLNKRFESTTLLGSMWKDEVERVGKDIGVALPTFAAYEVYEQQLKNVYAGRDNIVMSIFEDETIQKATDIYRCYKYAFGKVNKQ
eukprot:TRINITY_DN7597_c0_g1_i1.p1 TRINITY_DN7597_c0_g1~~TRINITY_DN7597_c0_g1_i1.p1  ORF type:complete len:110 (-),score=15.24 TRINITY_DN7597_c0_g1_i1:158-487(-)